MQENMQTVKMIWQMVKESKISSIYCTHTRCEVLVEKAADIFAMRVPVNISEIEGMLRLEAANDGIIFKCFLEDAKGLREVFGWTEPKS